MTTPLAGRTGATPTPLPEHERLRRVARDLEGVFVEQMFKAMRESVPEGGVVDGGTGEEMFTALLDQKMSALVPAKWDRGLAAAVYGQLQGRVSGGQGVGVSGGVSGCQGVRVSGTATAPAAQPAVTQPPALTPRHPDTPIDTPSSSPSLAPILSSDKRPEQP